MMAVPSFYNLPAAAPARKKITILGATGSIGTQTAQLIQAAPERFEVVAVTAHHHVEELAKTAVALNARQAVIADERHHAALKERLSGTGIEAAAGEKSVIAAAREPADIVVAAISGFAGLKPTLEAIRRGATIALANKECLVAAGPVFLHAVEKHHTTVLPVDSEHSAIFQILDHRLRDQVEKVILTASGGPFRTFTKEQMKTVTPTQAVQHPNWSMGAKISVDSATLMNKGLELIEAAYLFDLPPEKLDALVHPQSIVHSLVQYEDGSTLAQLGLPDMKTPISYALAWPRRMPVPGKRLDLAALGSLTFEAPDESRFPCLRLARQALQAGQGAPTVLNAANEVAVAAFLDGSIGFLDIAAIVENTLSVLSSEPLHTPDDVVDLDLRARAVAGELI